MIPQRVHGGHGSIAVVNYNVVAERRIAPAKVRLPLPIVTVPLVHSPALIGSRRLPRTTQSPKRPAWVATMQFGSVELFRCTN